MQWRKVQSSLLLQSQANRFVKYNKLMRNHANIRIVKLQPCTIVRVNIDSDSKIRTAT